MLGNRRLIIDTLSEVYTLLKPYSDGEFWDFNTVTLESGAIYIFGRQQFVEHKLQIAELAQTDLYRIVFCNAAEGSWTLSSQLEILGVEELVLDHKILLISGGDQQDNYPSIQYEHFLSEITNYDENHLEMARVNKIFAKPLKPYKFLFLNGRARPHRKYLYERFRRSGLLDQSLWTMLDSRPCVDRSLSFIENDINVMATVSELKWLTAPYEVPRYQDIEVDTTGPRERTFVKHNRFKNDWGEIYLHAEPYIDTYFSLVTETVLSQPWSFRTEKIAKPIMMGHPFIVATNAGYYRDLRNLGFKTFGHVIDESFDAIDNAQTRIDRIHDIVQDLCAQDLSSFLSACQDVCKYNQQHLMELVPELRSQFPSRFIQFIANYE